MRVLVLLALIITAVTAVPANPQRIVGGSLTTITNYPSIVALLYSSNLSTYSQNCGGSIINKKAILTAAHCVVGDAVATWRTRVGSTYANSAGVVHKTKKIIIHPNYNKRNEDNDIAIIQLSSNIKLNNYARAGNYPGVNYFLGDHQVVWAAGWGRTSYGGPASEQLRHVQTWTINQAICRQRYATIGDTVTDNMLCSGWLDAGGRDACQGDSGGPLYHNGVIVGVTSWGNGCAQAYYPGVNTRVSRVITWIKANS